MDSATPRCYAARVWGRIALSAMLESLPWVAGRQELGMKNKRRSLLFTLALAALIGLLGAHVGARSASAEGIGTINCLGGSTGLDDCTITLTATIASGGSFTATLNNPSADILACNTIPIGGSCTTTSTTVTFTCPNGCAAGTTYRDVVQLSSGSGAAQTFTANGTTTASTSVTSVAFPNSATAVYPLSASVGSGTCVTPFGAVVACGAGVIGVGGSCFTQGLIVPCSGLSSFGLNSNCFVTTNLGSFNLCTTNAFAGTSSSCISQSLVGLVNTCTGFNNAGCSALSPTGIIVNICGFQQFTTSSATFGFPQFTTPFGNFGFGVNGACIQTLQTLSGPVTVQVC